MSPAANLEALEMAARLQAKKERLARAKELQQAYGIDFYRPHWKQDRFHAAGHKVARYCRTGNRGGKTKCGAAEDVAHLLGGRLWYRNSFDVLDGTGKVVRRHV